MRSRASQSPTKGAAARRRGDRLRRPCPDTFGRRGVLIGTRAPRAPRGARDGDRGGRHTATTTGTRRPISSAALPTSQAVLMSEKCR